MVGEHTYDLHPWPVFCICLVVGSGPGLDVFRCQGDLGEGAPYFDLGRVVLGAWL